VRTTLSTQLLLTLVATVFSCHTPTLVADEPRHADDGATSHRSFADVDHWIGVFEDPERAAWQKPEELVAALPLKPGMAVADLGAGTGYFLPYLNRAVGPHGAVYALEPELSLLAHLRERIEKEQLNSVVPILASFDDPRLPEQSTDLVLIVDTYHHIDHRLDYLSKLRRALKPLGRVAIVDWLKRPLPKGPPPEHKLARDQVVAEMTRAGFELRQSPDLLPYQYFLIFRKLEATTSAE
jgi:ubiquinone/menaquinone biosynthesis C-methylase UbiE